MVEKLLLRNYIGLLRKWKLKLVAKWRWLPCVAAGVVNAAGVYSKDGNKLDLYGKVHAQHYFSDDSLSDGDKTYARLGFKGETRINVS